MSRCVSRLARPSCAMVALVLTLPAGHAMAEDVYPINWTRQFGTAYEDDGLSVDTDGSGNIYISGKTAGAFSGYSNAGGDDIFLSKYDALGNPIWTHQFGTAEDDQGYTTQVDPFGNVYISGTTEGALDGQVQIGERDGFLTKYDQTGNKLWTRQFGTSGSETGGHVGTDALGNVYVAGYTSGALAGHTNTGLQDLFLIKYDASGNEVWTRQFGTTNIDLAGGIDVDAAGNTFFTGSTGWLMGDTWYGGFDTFLAKIDTDGNSLWTTQIGTTDSEYSRSVAVDDSGNAYITGYTYDAFPGFTNTGIPLHSDMFLAKFDASGNNVWTSQLGDKESDFGFGVAVDGTGQVFVSGFTECDLDGHTNAGYRDIILTKYDADGNKIWLEQLGTSAYDGSTSVAVDQYGRVYITGSTGDSLEGNTHLGDDDAFLIQFASPTIPGDLNGDGFVGLDDLDLILNNWNLTVPPGEASADPTGDGYVGLDDLDIVLGNWNAGTAPVSNMSIPEPMSLALLAAGGLGLFSRRGKRI